MSRKELFTGLCVALALFGLALVGVGRVVGPALLVAVGLVLCSPFAAWAVVVWVLPHVPRWCRAVGLVGGGPALRRRRVLLWALLILALVYLLLVILSLPWTGVNSDSYERIESGMTLKEVEGILGGPGRMGLSGPTRMDWEIGPDPSKWFWSHGKVTITVRLGEDGRVCAKDYEGPPEDGYLDYFRRLLPW
jgi:hypothetical protein